MASQTPGHPPNARCRRCGLPRTPWRHLTLSYWGKPYCNTCCQHIANDHDRNNDWPDHE